MIAHREIVNSFPLEEIEANTSTKFTVRSSIEYILATDASFSTAIKLADLILESCDEKIYPTDNFVHAHPDNNPEVYSSFEVWLALYLLMLSSKADNLYHIKMEMENGRCHHINIIGQNDKESCSLCKEPKPQMDLKDCTYQNIPPYHISCRCGIIIRK